MLLYTYIILLVITSIGILVGIKLSLRVPNKIKIISSISLVMLLLRYISLFIMILQENIKYMYMLESLYFLYFACIPIFGVVCLYILLRNDNINFKYVVMISFAYIIMYFIWILRASVKIILMNNYNLGYAMNLKNNLWYVDIIYLFINVAFLIVTVNIFNKERSDKIGSALAIFASLSTIVIIMLPYLLNNSIPQYCFNELLWVIALDYCLSKTGLKSRVKS